MLLNAWWMEEESFFHKYKMKIFPLKYCPDLRTCGNQQRPEVYVLAENQPCLNANNQADASTASEVHE